MTPNDDTRAAWSVIQDLRAGGACEEGLAWLTERASLADAWRRCERPDWLLYAAAELGANLDELARASIACADVALAAVRHKLRPGLSPKLRRLQALSRRALSGRGNVLGEHMAATSELAHMDRSLDASVDRDIRCACLSAARAVNASTSFHARECVDYCAGGMRFAGGSAPRSLRRALCAAIRAHVTRPSIHR